MMWPNKDLDVFLLLVYNVEISSVIDFSSIFIDLGLKSHLLKEVNFSLVKQNFDLKVAMNSHLADVRTVIYDPILILDIFLFASDWQSCLSYNEEVWGI